MRHAWQLWRRERAIVERAAAKGRDLGELEPFSFFLRQAWADAKAHGANMLRAAELRKTSPIRQRIADLQHRTRLGVHGLKELATLRTLEATAHA